LKNLLKPFFENSGWFKFPGVDKLKSPLPGLVMISSIYLPATVYTPYEQIAAK